MPRSRSSFSWFPFVSVPVVESLFSWMQGHGKRVYEWPWSCRFQVIRSASGTVRLDRSVMRPWRETMQAPVNHGCVVFCQVSYGDTGSEALRK